MGMVEHRRSLNVTFLPWISVLNPQTILQVTKHPHLSHDITV
jgi:hypothetical protein